MKAETERSSLQGRIAELIGRLADGGSDDAARDALIEELAAWQRQHVAAYGQFCRQIKPSAAALTPPALPTTAFRHARVAAHAEAADVRRFLSSGTTRRERSQHALRDLQLYRLAAQAAAQRWLFGRQQWFLILLAAEEAEARESSLSFMLARFVEWFGKGPPRIVWRQGRLQSKQLVAALAEATQQSTPVALLGTSFAFVHAEDALAQQRFVLPPGSLLMHTGGFKGRSRSIAASELQTQLGWRYRLPPQHVRLEYGMTELSSQLYDAGIEETSGLPVYRVPGWVRATVVHPATLAPLPMGEIGLLRLDDLANLDSCCCLLTEDLASWTERGLCLHGRAADAPRRGCSLDADFVDDA